MNIDDLTLGQIKVINKLTGSEKTSKLTDSAIGKYVIVRSRNEGLNAGIVVNADETGIILKNARRLWYSKPKNSTESWYEGVSQVGLHSESKVSSTTIEKIIVEDYSITICSEAAQLSIEGAKTNES